MQWMAYLAWRGGPLLALACSTGSNTLGGARRGAPLQTIGSIAISHEESSMLKANVSAQNMNNYSLFFLNAWLNRVIAHALLQVSIRRWNVRFDVRETLFHLAARVLEDLQRRLCNLLVVHLQTTQQGLECLCGVEWHRVCKRQHLFGIKKRKGKVAACHC